MEQPIPNANALQGDFGESWLEVVAAGCGLIHGRPGKVDLEMADVELTFQGELSGTLNPCVKAQVKTTTAFRAGDVNAVSYDLDVATYRFLRRTNHAVRRVLVVFEVVRPQLFRLEEEPGTILLGRGLWTSLEAMPDTTNQATESIRIPVTNTVDRDGLRRMMEELGTPKSSVVPTISGWEGT